MTQIAPRPRGRKRSLFPSIEQQWSDQVRLVIVSPNGGPGCYSATVAGEIVSTSSRTPFCDAARALLDRGIDSNSWLILRHAGSDVDSLRGKVGIIAKLTVRETDTDGPRFARWKPFPSRAVAPPVRSNGSGLPVTPASAENAL